MKKTFFAILTKILFAQTLVIYSGFTMKYPVKELVRNFEKEHPDVKVVTLFGKSSSLYNKMLSQHKCDIFFTENDKLIKRDLKIFSDVVKTGKNKLVLMVKKGNPKKIKTLNDLRKPAISVIIGAENTYLGVKTAEMLKKYEKLYNSVNKKALKGTEEEIAASVVTDADCAIGWQGLAYWQNNRDFIDIIPVKDGDVMQSDLIMGVTAFAPNKNMARRFLEFAKSPKGQLIMRKWGF